MTTLTPKQEQAAKMANSRVPKALKALELVGDLAKKDFLPEHRAKIVEAISAAYDSVMEKFQPKPESKKPVFSL